MNTRREKEEILRQIKAGNERLTKEVYLAHRSEFILWMAKNFGTSDDLGSEFFQDSFLVFIENVLSGKLVSLSSSIKTYLFSIGRNKFYEYKRKQERDREIDSSLEINSIASIETNSETDFRELRKGLSALGDPCAKLLHLFYFERASLQEIAEKLGYKNTQTAKNQKYKCIIRLREIMKKENKHD